jgi:hypothetical protein
MSHENKNIYTSNDGTKTGIHKTNPTAPVHIGQDIQVDADAVVSGDTTIGQDLTVNQNATITGNQSIGGTVTSTGKVTANKGVQFGDFTDTPDIGHVRWHSGDLEVWDGSVWKSLTQGGFDLQEQMQMLDVTSSFASFTPKPVNVYNPPDLITQMVLSSLYYTLSPYTSMTNPLQGYSAEASS